MPFFSSCLHVHHVFTPPILHIDSHSCVPNTYLEKHNESFKWTFHLHHIYFVSVAWNIWMLIDCFIFNNNRNLSLTLSFREICKSPDCGCITGVKFYPIHNNYLFDYIHTFHQFNFYKQPVNNPHRFNKLLILCLNVHFICSLNQLFHKQAIQFLSVRKVSVLLSVFIH